MESSLRDFLVQRPPPRPVFVSVFGVGSAIAEVRGPENELPGDFSSVRLTGTQNPQGLCDCVTAMGKEHSLWHNSPLAIFRRHFQII